jgi:hypothetical protein
MTHEESFDRHVGHGTRAIIAALGFPESPAGTAWVGGFAQEYPTPEEDAAELAYERERAIWLRTQCPGCEPGGGMTTLCASCLAYVLDEN